jgi:hypothetical protein
MASTKTHGGHSAFLLDGPARLAEGIRSLAYEKIRATVAAEYSGRLESAGFLRRVWLRHRMEVEIERRLKSAIAAQSPSEEALW